MRIRLIALTCPLLALACGGSSKATTGEEFLEKFQAAVKEKEAGTLWKMLSKKTRRLRENEIKYEVRNGYYHETQKDTLLKEFHAVKWTGDGDKDLREIKPERLCLDRLQRRLDKGGAYRDFRDYRFLEEKSEGKGVLLTVKTPSGQKVRIVLAREDDYLKFDEELTGKYSPGDE